MKQALADHVIDLVLLDLRLNGEDGMQLARGLDAKKFVKAGLAKRVERTCMYV